MSTMAMHQPYRFVGGTAAHAAANREVLAHGASTLLDLAVFEAGLGAMLAIPEKQLDNWAHFLGKHLVEPYLLDGYESVSKQVCHLKECRIDTSKSRDERAVDAARTMIVYTPPLALSLVAKNEIRHWVHDRFKHPSTPQCTATLNPTLKQQAYSKIPFIGWSPTDRMIGLADEGVLLGSMYVMGNQLSGVSDEMIKSLTGVMKKTFGMSEKKAHELATGTTMWAIPDAMGFLAGSAVIMGKHLRDWPSGFAKSILSAGAGHER